MRRAMRAGLISEQSIKEALTEAKGDIFLASCALDCTAQELDRYIRRSPALQSFAAAVEQVKLDPAYSRMSAEQFENQLADLTRAYRVEGLQEIHKLATLDYGDSAALAKVKLEAAMALRGASGHGGGHSEAENTMAELDALYRQNAPRIKEIRKTVITFEDGSEANQPVIELQPVR